MVLSLVKADFAPRKSRLSIAQLQFTTSQKSLEALTKYSATETITLDAKAKVIARSPAVSTSEEVKYSIISPDGSRLAKFRVRSGKDGKGEKRVIEILTGRGERKMEEIDVTKQTGDFYFDGTFSTFPPSTPGADTRELGSYLWCTLMASRQPASRLHRRISLAETFRRPLRSPCFRQIPLHTRLWRNLYR